LMSEVVSVEVAMSMEAAVLVKVPCLQEVENPSFPHTRSQQGRLEKSGDLSLEQGYVEMS